MDAKSLAAQLDGVQVIDVREPFEWEAGRIRGAHHIPLNQLAQRMDEIDPAKSVVAVCFGGARSAYASQFLHSQGVEALNLEGGLQSWVRQGLPLITGDGAPGRLVHDPPSRPAPEGETEGGSPSAGPVAAGAVPTLDAQRAPNSEEGQAASSDEVDRTALPSNVEADETGDLSPEMEHFKDTILEVVFASQERFGDEEPSEEEVHQFMKDWLMSKGKSAKEAEEILGQ